MSGGAGHVMRCWALAEEFTSREHNVSWLGKVDIPWLAAALAREGWQVISPNGEEQSQVQQLIDMSTDIVVVDSYWISNRFYEEAMSAGITVVTVTDDARDHLMPGNILVNPGVTLGLTPCDPAAQFLDGPDYIFIRQEIRKFRKQRLESLERKNLDIIRRPLRITVMLGGTDAAGLAPTLARQLAELAPTAELTVGPATPTSGPGQAEKSSGSSEADVTWLPAGPDLLRAAAASDLVISAAGVSSWELLYLGVPLALVQVVENQTGNYQSSSLP